MSPRRLLTLSLAPALAAALALSSPGASVSPPGAEPDAVLETGAQPRASQSGRLLMHPQISQPGRRVRSPDAARSAMSAVFRPAREGRTVVLQRRKEGRWVAVDRKRQNRRGIAQFTAAYKNNGRVHTYRAVAVRGGGLGKVTTGGVAADKWGAAAFTDEFSGTALGPAWNHRLQGYQPGSKRKCSKAAVEAVSVGDGAVRIGVLDDPVRPTLMDELNGTQKCSYEGEKYAWRLNGSIGTKNVQSFKYGYAAARVKFQPRRGQHAAFWLQPESTTASEGSAKKTGAEIDVIEWFGQGHPSGGLTSFIYHYPDDGKPGITPKKVGGFIRKPGRFGGKWAGRYHVFSVEWTPNRYVFRIDGKETFRTGKGVSGRPQYLILSLLSSDYELQYLGGDDNLPQQMKVDWVRYWQR